MTTRCCSKINAEYNVYTQIAKIIVDELLNSLNQQAAFEYTKLSNRVSEEVANAFSNCKDERIQDLLKQAKNIIVEIYDNARCCFPIIMLIEIELITRLTIHVNNPYMPLDIGLSWHPLLNLPYIPATAIKGLLRAYTENRGLRPCQMDIDTLFGVAGEKPSEGLLVVTDAFPVKCDNKLIDVDVITPHYREPSGIIDEPRANPTPLVYPTVSPGVRFWLVLFLRKLPTNTKCIMETIPTLVNDAFSWGVGAKTSLGYGVARAKLVNTRFLLSRGDSDE